MTTYRLQSAPFVHAPGLIAWAINGYNFEADRQTLVRIVSETWNIPKSAAELLISGRIPYRIDHILPDPDGTGETVVFEWGE